MSLQNTPSSQRVHISFFGRRNAGKSSLVNAVTGQQLSVVSDVEGTTTDPVRKAMELLPLGPVVIIDTPGFDDVGELGKMRVQRTLEVLRQTDIAVLVADGSEEQSPCEVELKALFEQEHIPYITVYNKSDLPMRRKEGTDTITVSAQTGAGIHALKEKLAHMLQEREDDRVLVQDLLPPCATVVLVVPIDSAAPKGRLILPQQQVLRDLLDGGHIAVVCRETELKQSLERLQNRVDLVITDSQAFGVVSEIVPHDIPLTSFSILMARYKGFLDHAMEGMYAVDSLKDGDRVLIAEGCTHHRQCEDIGTVKIPRWLREYTGKELIFETVSGREFPEDLSPYAMIVHCGGCMLTPRAIRSRMEFAGAQKIPVLNYGMLIAHMKGILQRALAPLSKTPAGQEKV